MGYAAPVSDRNWMALASLCHFGISLSHHTSPDKISPPPLVNEEGDLCATQSARNYRMWCRGLVLLTIMGSKFFVHESPGVV